MTGPELSGPLEGLKIAGLEDLARYKAAVEAGQQMGWGYYFPYLLSRNRPGRRAMLLAEDDGSMCVFLWQIRDSWPRLDLYLPPTPMNVPVLRRCIERANNFNRDTSACIMRIDERDVDAVSASGLRSEPRRGQYLYAPSAYDDLSSKSHYTIRRNAALVGKLPDVEVLPYSAQHAGDCHALVDQWQKAFRESNGTGGGAGISRRAIELAEALPDRDLRGEVVLIDGRLAAFAFGGEIRPGLAASFERKCDVSIRGLSYFHFHSFLLRLRDFDLVNDASDTGRAGLRQLKQSFRPVAMHGEYRGRQS